MSFFRSLQLRLLLLLVLVAVIPIGLVSAINLRIATRLVQEEVQARQIEVTQIAHDEVSQFIADILVRLETLGRGSIDLALVGDELNRYLISYLEPESSNEDIFHSVWLMDVAGNELAGLVAGEAIAPADLQNRSEDEIFFRPQRGEIYFSNVRLTNGSPEISLSVPIHDAMGQFVGVAGGVIDLQEAWTVIQNLQIGQGGYAMLLDRRGNIMVHPDANVLAAVYTLAASPPYVAAIHAEALAVYHYKSPIAGEVIGSALSIEGPDWVLMVERPTSEAYATISQAQNTIYFGVAIALVVAFGMSLFLSRQIARPIVGLRDVVQRFGAGFLTVRSNLRTHDEIGQLSEGFNTMADRLKSRIEEIDEKNKALQEANAKVLESVRLKDEFLAMMSHELRTPLNAIIGFSGILLMDEGAMNEKQTFQVQRIEANSERLLALINDILDISRIQAGRMSINPEELDIRRLVKRLSEQLEVLAKAKHLEFSYSLADDLPQTIWADEDALIKIITNLSANAIKFTAEGSVKIELSREGQNLVIRLSDTGIGIPPQLQELIFEEFRQVDSSSMRSYGGTGLGLAIVRRLALAMGGGVSVKSRVNEGSVFTVSLPLLEEAETKGIGGKDVQAQ